MMRYSARAKAGSPAFGVSLLGSLRRRCAASGRGMPRRSQMARACSRVDGSGTVGPEAITAGSSKGTSEIASVRIERALRAASARRPPLMRERCLRTVLISPIGAPERSIARVIACFSESVRSPAGAIQLAEPPPESSTSTSSSGPASPAMRSASCVAAMPASSGTGWPASTMWMPGASCP